jgi:ubiquinone/menaquinone biosynthesis C-methylase UbiE
MSEVKLNIGCGEDIREDFVNIDVQSFPGVQKIRAGNDLHDYADNSVDFIVASHLLEYIPRKEMLSYLTEWQRVLKPECALEIRVTDLAQLTKALYLNTISKEMGLHHEMVLSLIYGRQSTDHDIRQNGFTGEFLQGILTGLGFRIVNSVVEEYDIIVTAVKQ